MARYMGVNEAVQALRGKFFTDRSFRGHPEEAHQIKFAKEVAKALSGNDDAETVIHVMALLREEGIELPAGQEYPKFATRKHDRMSTIVQNAEEEDKWVNMEPPAPADPDNLAPLGVIEAPVQDLTTDLRRSVPGDHQLGDLEPPRVPSAVTNREAAQDAYARQPVSDRDAAAAAYDRDNPNLDHTNADAARGHGTFQDVQTGHGVTQGDDHSGDDAVHVEDVNLDTKAPNADVSKGGATYAKPAGTGVMAHDDPDRDGVAGQDKDPTHDSVLGTEEPKHKSGESSAGRTDKSPRPVGTGRNPNKRP